MVSLSMTFEEFFKRQPVLLPLFDRLYGFSREKFPELRVRIEEHQLTFYDRYPYCKVCLPSGSEIKVENRDSLVISFELPMKLLSRRFAKVEMINKEKFLHYVVADNPGDIDEELVAWIEMSREWNNLYAHRFWNS